MVDTAMSAFGRLDILGEQRRLRPPEPADAGGRRGDLSTGSTRSTSRRSSTARMRRSRRPPPPARGGVIPQHRLDRGRAPAPGADLVQRVEGGRRSPLTRSMAVELGAGEDPRRRGSTPFAGETGMLATFLGEDTEERRAQFRRHDPDGPPLAARRHRQRGAVPVLRGGGVPHRRVHGGRRRGAASERGSKRTRAASDIGDRRMSISTRSC